MTAFFGTKCKEKIDPEQVVYDSNHYPYHSKCPERVREPQALMSSRFSRGPRMHACPPEPLSGGSALIST